MQWSKIRRHQYPFIARLVWN